MAEYWGYDATLSYGDGAPTEAFTAVGQLRDLDGPSLSAATIDVTHRGTTKWAKFIGGLKDGGEVSFDIVYDPDLASHDDSTGLPSFLGELKNWRVTFPDTTPTTCTFPAVLTGFNPTAPMADALTAAVTLKVAGAPAWA